MDKDKQIKQLIYGEAVRPKILLGLWKVYEAVATTLGSKGRNVAIELNWGDPNIIHDGVTVAKAIALEDPFENMAAQLVIKAAQKTNEIAGDGTTTATILTYAIGKEALQNVSAGINPAPLRKGINKAVSVVVSELKKMATSVTKPEELTQVATISAADPIMGEMVSKAIQKVGKDGVVTVQEGGSETISVEYKEGMEFEKGWVSIYMMTDEKEQKAVLEVQKSDYPYVVVVDEKLDNDSLVTLLEKIYDFDLKAKILLVAVDFDNVAISTLVLTKLRGNKQLIAVKAPDFGPHRTNILDDIATLTGGQLLGGETGIPLAEMTVDSLGKVERVEVTKDQTLIIGGKGKEEKIKERIAGLDKLIEQYKNDPAAKNKYETRKAKLVGGVAVVSVNDPSDQEKREIKERVYDAVNATKAAIAEGIVPGGGIAFLRARQVIEELKFEDDKERMGADIVKRALAYPTRRLISNAGVDMPDYILGKILENTDKNIGYNVDSESMEDLIASGIIDPVKVSRTALEQAASAAIMLMTTDVMIAFDREITKKQKESIDGIGQFLD